MNDRFKFRVWNKEEKKMYYDAQNTYDYMTGEPIIFAESFGCLLNNDEEWEVEQCTGLKDKNGNLIYIGDIIKCGNGPLNTATVNYENGENFIDGIYPFNLYHDCGDTCHCQLRNYPEYACEIIGNIHEQKDNK